MEEGKIYLKSRDFNEWMDNLGQEITKVKDSLVILEAEEGQLSGLWESSAKEEWEQELRRIVEQVRSCVADMEALASKTGKKAEALARMEKIMIYEAEGV